MDIGTSLPTANAANIAQLSSPVEINKTGKDIDKTARDFEAMFIAQMLKPMFETLPTDGPFGGGNAESTFRTLLVEEYGKSVANSGGIGIADDIKAELIKAQEAK